MRSALVWTAAAALMLLGGCGDGDDDSGPGSGVDDPGSSIDVPAPDDAELRSFVEVGSGPGVPELEPLWLDDEDARTSAVQALTDAADNSQMNPELVDEAVDALQAPAQEGTRSVAFLLTGCAETGAQLNIDGSTITADLTGGEDVLCDAAVYFLAIFDIPTDDIPENAHLD